MAFRIKASHVIAAAIVAAVAGWMYTGEVVIGGQSADGEGVKPIAEREAERSAETFRVRYVPVQPEQRFEEVLVRGRTQADAIVPVRAQVSGTLEQRLVDKGSRVEEGQLVCVIDRGAREADLAQSKALLVQAQGDFDAHKALADKGFTAQTKLNSVKAALDAARAAVVRDELELERTEVRASAAGIVQDPIAEVGDVMTVGATCITLINSNPMLFVGQVSERDVGRFDVGAGASITLITGRQFEGEVRYIAPSSDPKTRTFLTEIEIPNRDGDIRDGLTAQARIKLPPIAAYRISPAWLTLADTGQVGVRAVDDDNIVRFIPVQILAQTNKGFWITGIEPGTRVITLGQEFVVEGTTVEPVLETAALAGAEQ